MLSKSLAMILLSTVCGLAVGAEPAAGADKTEATARMKSERPNCLKETGTRLKKKDGDCVAAPGQVITHEDIENSGATTAAEAIRRLSPASQVRGH